MKMKRGLLFSHGEENTYRILKDFFKGKPNIVYKEVAVSQVIDVTREELASREWSYYMAASFDFVVCRDDASQTVEFAIEFDSAFHDNPDREWKDRLKDGLCGRVGLPLIRIRSDHVLKREGVPLLHYMLEMHYGEKAVQKLVSKGQLSSEEEYFPGTQFEGITELQKRLSSKGVFPPAVPLSIREGSDLGDIYWYRVSSGSKKSRESPDERTNVGVAKLELLHGWGSPRIVTEIERAVTLKNCAPSFNVLGVHGWFIANELALYLCFQELERQVAKKLVAGRRRG